MKVLACLVFLILFLSVFAYTAQVYGSLKEGNRAVGEGVEIRIIHSGNTYSGMTDTYGSYNIYVPERGRCTFIVHYRGQWPEAAIYSYDDPVRYDFDLVRQSDGRYILVRR